MDWVIKLLKEDTRGKEENWNAERRIRKRVIQNSAPLVEKKGMQKARLGRKDRKRAHTC